MWGIRVIVPSKLRERVLTELDIDVGHPRIVKIKSAVRTLVWRPGIDEELESFIQKCYPSQSICNKSAPTLLHPWSWPSTRAGGFREGALGAEAPPFQSPLAFTWQ